MTPTETKLESRHETKTRFLNVALHVIHAKATPTHGSRLTRGSFFHHFESREALALGAADYRHLSKPRGPASR
jgi:TetR/AcrR family transcriptional repressor of nem operon